jgi:hypothetical protein
VWGWGLNTVGQLADGTTANHLLPARVQLSASQDLDGVTAIVAGGAHAIARVAGGGVRTWGSNDSGQVGDGSSPNVLVPVPISFPARLPPIATASASPAVLRPPTHKMVPVTIALSASDSCTGTPQIALTGATSSEADDGSDDGHTTDDIGAVTRVGDTFTIELRAERSGTGTGRVYTITFAVTDAAGNQTAVDVAVAVPL